MAAPVNNFEAKCRDLEDVICSCFPEDLDPDDDKTTMARCIVGYLLQPIVPQGDERERQLESGLSKVIFCEFTCDNLYIITGSSSGSLKIWNFETCELVDKVRGSPDLICSLSHHGEYVSYNERDRILTVLEIATCSAVVQLKGHQGKILCSAWSRDNEFIITGGYDRIVKIWEFSTGECVNNLEGHFGYITVIKTTEKDEYLITASDDRSLRIWDFFNGECLHICGEHTGWISSIVISQDQRFVISGSIYVLDRSIKVWDILTGELVYDLSSHGDSTKLITTYDDVLISAGDKNMIYVWDLTQGKLKNMIEIGVTKAKITSFITVDNTLGVVGGMYGKLDLWNINKGKRTKKYKNTGSKDVINALGISHNGWLVACTNGTSNCRLWNVYQPS